MEEEFLLLDPCSGLQQCGISPLSATGTVPGAGQPGDSSGSSPLSLTSVLLLGFWKVLWRDFSVGLNSRA